MGERGSADTDRLSKTFREMENDPCFQRGIIYSYTTPNPESPVYPEGFKGFAPYILAIVEFSDGRKCMTQITDLGDEKLQIGMPVERVTRKLYTAGKDGLIIYGPKYRPALVQQPRHV